MNDLTQTISQILMSSIGKDNRIGIDRILGQLDVLCPDHGLNKPQLPYVIDDLRAKGRIERLIYKNNCYYVCNDVNELRQYINKYDDVLYLEMAEIIDVLKEQLQDYEEVLKEFV